MCTKVCWLIPLSIFRKYFVWFCSVYPSVHCSQLCTSYDQNKYLILVGMIKSDYKEQINSEIEAEISLNNIEMCHT